jgi:hypothetical protein
MLHLLSRVLWLASLPNVTRPSLLAADDEELAMAAEDELVVATRPLLVEELPLKATVSAGEDEAVVGIEMGLRRPLLLVVLETDTSACLELDSCF